ncbi:MAG: phenylalanine--tRNA ligase subunit alpha [Patescibacteria group bacterium]|jgi:phenylalanyl-tRNA synthetase alpha chain
MISTKDFEKLIITCESDIKSGTEFDVLSTKYLGRKGLYNALVKEIPSLQGDLRKEIGSVANATKIKLESLLTNSNKQSNSIDLTSPLQLNAHGHQHPVQAMIHTLYDIFGELGFSEFKTPDIELEFDNFDFLRVPKDHPARDMQDTFWTVDKDVLRTQTTAFQKRVLAQLKPPFAVMQAGRVFRAEADDSTHLSAFHQFDIFAVTDKLSFADLRGVLLHTTKKLFGEDTKTRFRPGYFPFVEPGAEIDIACKHCAGKGCKSCGNKGWLELLGCGMSHPEIIANGGLDPKIYRGIAFGVGVERLCMAKYGITDIRELTKNDPRFLEQGLY